MCETDPVGGVGLCDRPSRITTVSLVVWPSVVRGLTHVGVPILRSMHD